MAVIIAVACGGKALHTHSDSYWRSFVQTETAARGGASLVDDCPVCHYNICFFHYGELVDFSVFVTQLECCCFAVTCSAAAEPVGLPALRGSPVLSTVIRTTAA